MYAACKTVGIIVSVRKCLSFCARRSFRMQSIKSPRFPQIIKVRYEVDGVEYIKRKALRLAIKTLTVGASVAVYYQINTPKKFRIEI